MTAFLTLPELPSLTDVPDDALIPVWSNGRLYAAPRSSVGSGGGGGGGGGHVIESNGTPITQRADLNVTGLLQAFDSGGKSVLHLPAIGLDTQVSGVLPIASGGTGLSVPGAVGQSLRYTLSGALEAYTPSAGLTAPTSPADNGKVALALSGNLVYSLLNNTHIAPTAGIMLTQLQALSADRLVGADDAGAPVQLTVGGGLAFTGSGGIQREALTGDVTAPAGSNTTTISNLSRSKIAGAVTQGSNLTNADQTLTVAGGSEYTMAASQTSVAREKTLGTGGSPETGALMTFYMSAQGHNVTFKNGGVLLNTVYTLTAGQARELTFEYDGANWLPPTIRMLA